MAFRPLTVAVYALIRYIFVADSGRSADRRPDVRVVHGSGRDGGGGGDGGGDVFLLRRREAPRHGRRPVPAPAPRRHQQILLGGCEKRPETVRNQQSVGWKEHPSRAGGFSLSFQIQPVFFCDAPFLRPSAFRDGDTPERPG